MKTLSEVTIQKLWSIFFQTKRTKGVDLTDKQTGQTLYAIDPLMRRHKKAI